ncbi:MAG TPA: homoserine kinase [Vicinamibacterales bacterium]|nr:homoserine kinase [Vicinamibacterales bacterium]
MIAVFAPATVSNVACGFDVLGFALDTPGDVVTAEAATAEGVEIAEIEGDGGRLSRDPSRNTAGTAVQALLARLGAARGIRLTIGKGIPLASGIGSSGASAVAAVVAVNELLGRPAPLEVLLECAMLGEVAGCGAAHPDNVAPALFGGFVLARSAAPPDVVRLPVPDGLCCVVLHPHLEVETGAARALLGDSVPLGDAVRQWANVGAMVAGLFLSDLPLIGRALEDRVSEPKRAHLVPGFALVKEAARATGALGCSLSGSGPSIFALCASRDRAVLVGEAMRAAFLAAADLGADLWVSPVGTRGARIVAG